MLTGSSKLDRWEKGGTLPSGSALSSICYNLIWMYLCYVFQEVKEAIAGLRVTSARVENERARQAEIARQRKEKKKREKAGKEGKAIELLEQADETEKMWVLNLRSRARAVPLKILTITAHGLTLDPPSPTESGNYLFYVFKWSEKI